MKKAARQLELPLPRPAGSKTPLSPEAAACLAAIKAGAATISRAAIAAKLDQRASHLALLTLTSEGLVERKGERGWLVPTLRGKRVRIAIVKPPPKRRGQKTVAEPGSSALRMLKALETPMSGRALAKAIGVTPQRVMQLLIGHLSTGAVRTGDPGSPMFVIARGNDKRLLLTRHQARLMSVLRKDEPSALGAVAATAYLPRKQADILLWGLADAGIARSTGRNLWQLTEDGARHFQRDAKRKPAKPLRLPVYSDRVVSVLSVLSEQGPQRAIELSESFGIPRASMNALMQYLKRRGLARKTGLGVFAPHALTALGHETLDAIRRRAKAKP